MAWRKNQRINDFYIGYMMNLNLNTNKFFREQVMVCLKNTFGTSTMENISKLLLKPNTRVLALVMFYENREKMQRKCSECWVVSFIQIISKYICIDYLGSEKSKLSYLRLGIIGRYKHLDKKYDKVLVFVIPDILLN